MTGHVSQSPTFWLFVVVVVVVAVKYLFDTQNPPKIEEEKKSFQTNKSLSILSYHSFVLQHFILKVVYNIVCLF